MNLMNPISKKFLNLSVRYVLLILFSLGSLWIFYFIFTPFTVYPLYFLFNYFFGAMLNETTIYVRGIPVELIEACIAGSAYYFLLIFNLSTPGIKIPRRLKMIFFAFFIFLIVNILRIFSLTILYMSGSSFFDITHKMFWYLGSVLLVILIWFYQVKIYRIKEIPFYSDLRFLYKNSILAKRR